MTRAEEITEAARIDHARAGERGERLRQLLNAIVRVLMAHGMYGSDLAGAKPEIFHVLADDIYGNRAIDIPDLDR
jgi:hypothetical protein